MRQYYNALTALLNHIFPATCLYCHEVTPCKSLCTSCAELLFPLHNKGRCWRCFCKRPCKGCRDSPFARIAGALPYYGPICSILNALPRSPHLAKGCAGYMAYQTEAIRFRTPDILVPAPCRKGSAIDLLTSALAQLFAIPQVRALSRQGVLRKDKELKGKMVLLVTDVVDEQCEKWGIALQEARPDMLYGMALCFDDED